MKWLLVLAVLFQVVPAAAQDQDASDRLVEAAVLLDAAQSANERVSALTEAIRAYESGLAIMRDGIREAALKERGIRSRLAEEDADIASLLALLQAFSNYTGTQALAHPGSAVDTARAGTLVASVVPELQVRAESLAAELRELREVRLLQEASRASFAKAADELRQARRQLAEAMADRGDLPDGSATDEAAIAALIENADTLTGFVQSLIDSETSGKIELASWAPVVEGKVFQAFGELDEAGDELQGLKFQAIPGALVTSPANASVRFSGAAPEFETVIILEPAAGTLVILTGLATRFVEISQIVSEGEPIGLMPGAVAEMQEKLNGSERESGLFALETLYMEVRQGRQPIDPAAILRLGNE